MSCTAVAPTILRSAAGPRALQALALALLLLAPASSTAQEGGAPPRPITLQVKGSDTIGGALGPALAAGFEAQTSRGPGPGTRVRWESLGSGTAFVGLFDGSADIGASSRSVRESELAEARRLGLQLKEYILGYDGIAVLVHPTLPLDALTLDQLAEIFSGTVTRWSEVGGPDRPIRVISRPSYSGTHGFFKETVLEGRRESRGGSGEFGPATEWIEHSEEIVARVASDPNAISYLGMGWVGPGVKAVRVAPEPGAEAVAASRETVRTGRYPIYRPLLLYTRGEPTGEMRRFLSYMLAGDGQQRVAEHGFIPSDMPNVVSRQAGTPGTPDEDQGGELVRVSFASGGDRLSAEARASLDGIARRVRSEGYRVLLVGHADSEGTPDQNRRMARRRALAVARYLEARGVPESLISLESRGADQPVATNETDGGRRQNRRVDIRLIPR